MPKTLITLDFNGKELSFRFGLSFLEYFFKKEGLDPYGIYQKIKTEALIFIPSLMYDSHVHCCERNGGEAELEKHELFDLVEETSYFNDGSVSSKFVVAFLESIISALPEPEEEEKKKD